MKKLLKDNLVKRIVFSGIVLIFVYWIFNNLAMFGSVIGNFVGIIMPFITGLVIAFIFNVPMRFIEKHLFKGEKFEKKPRIKRLCSYLITLAAIIFIMTVVLIVLIPQIGKTIAEIIKVIPVAAAQLQQWAVGKLVEFPEIEEYIKGINIDWSALLKSVASFLTDGTKGVISGGIDAVSGIISGVTTFFIGFVFSIYVLFQKETLARQLKKVMYALMPEQTNKKILEVMQIADTTFSNFLSGQCLEACILGSMFVISMTILRMPYAVLIGVLIAVTALIPIVGAFIGCIVGALLICMSNPLQALAFIILFLVLQQIEGNLIYPHVVGLSLIH
uniref:AI-2E family transporter n=1 Tax=Lachnospira sp. TaxID=2049031 RepID=UPI003FEF012B